MRQRNSFLPFQTDVQGIQINKSAPADRKLVSSVEWALQEKEGPFGDKKKVLKLEPLIKEAASPPTSASQLKGSV